MLSVESEKIDTSDPTGYTLKEPVDSFFDQVMIMVDDKKVRDNRLALLAGLHHLFTQVADISLLP